MTNEVAKQLKAALKARFNRAFNVMTHTSAAGAQFTIVCPKSRVDPVFRDCFWSVDETAWVAIIDLGDDVRRVRVEALGDLARVFATVTDGRRFYRNS